MAVPLSLLRLQACSCLVIGLLMFGKIVVVDSAESFLAPVSVLRFWRHPKTDHRLCRWEDIHVAQFDSCHGKVFLTKFWVDHNVTQKGLIWRKISCIDLVSCMRNTNVSQLWPLSLFRTVLFSMNLDLDHSRTFLRYRSDTISYGHPGRGMKAFMIKYLGRRIEEPVSDPVVMTSVPLLCCWWWCSWCCLLLPYWKIFQIFPSGDSSCRLSDSSWSSSRSWRPWNKEGSAPFGCRCKKSDRTINKNDRTSWVLWEERRFCLW